MRPPNTETSDPATDSDTTIAELRELVREFVEDRDWNQFHSPKNLTMALSIEVGELMEHFQWLTPDASRLVSDDQGKRAEIGEEMADVLCYLLAISNVLDLDLSAALKAKMIKNAIKYPVAEFRGRYGPEDPGPSAS